MGEQLNEMGCISRGRFHIMFNRSVHCRPFSVDFGFLGRQFPEEWEWEVTPVASAQAAHGSAMRQIATFAGECCPELLNYQGVEHYSTKLRHRRHHRTAMCAFVWSPSALLPFLFWGRVPLLK